MPQIADLPAINKALKIIYPDRQVKFVGYQGNPALALLPKNEKFKGKQMDICIWYGGNQGASRTFSVAKQNKTPGLYDNFNLTRVKDYGLTSISNEALLASEGAGAAAFLDLSKAEIDNTVRTVSRNYALSLYRNAGGARGIAGNITGTALTLANSADVVNFEKGQVIKQATTDGTTGSVGLAAGVTITAVDRRAGILYGADWTGFSTGNWLFRDGDFGLSVSGFDAWIPAVAPVSGDPLFFGCDRSQDTRLYGQFHDGSGQTIEEGLQDLDAKLTAEGGEADYVFGNPKDINTLRKNLGSSVVYDKVKSPDLATVSFETVKLMGMTGPIQVVADRNCPAGTMYMLTMPTWEACTLGGGPRVLENMGMRFIWDTDSDSIEGRIGYYGNLGCHAPGYNGRLKLY